MPNEQINLSDALDLIMQSKTDIKSSVQGKGSEIGDDLTQYAQSIDNIQFRSLQFKNNDTGDMQTSFDVSRYNDTANVSVQQYINGETSYPVNTSYTVSGTSISVTKNTPGTNKQVYRCVPTNYGTTILTIEDTVGNVEYPIALHVPAITIYGDYNNTMSGFDSFEWDENIPAGDGGSISGWNAAWDTSVQQNPNFTATFSFNDGNGHNVDAANLSFDITGDVIDAGLATVTYVTSASSVTFTFTPHINDMTGNYEYYNGVINIGISDGTSAGDIAPIYLTGGSDIPETETYYIYAGNITNATVTFDDGIGIEEGQTETITVTPDSGYVLNTLVVEGDTTGDTIETTDLGNGEYSFVMPAEDVNIHVDCILDDDSSDDSSDEPTNYLIMCDANDTFKFNNSSTVTTEGPDENYYYYIDDLSSVEPITSLKEFAKDTTSTIIKINFDTSNVTVVEDMVYQANSLDTLELSGCDFSSCSDFKWIFYNNNIGTIDLRDVILPNGADYSKMFDGTQPYLTIIINSMDVLNKITNNLSTAGSGYPQTNASIYYFDGDNITDRYTWDGVAWTVRPYFSSPLDGDTITGEIDPDSGDFKYPIELCYSNGDQIPYDITATSVTCDNQDVAVGYTEDADENDNSYISGVYIYIYHAGSGTATLTYDDGEQTCTTTFTYDISEGGSEPSFTYDGSDENSPLQVNVDLANYPGGEIDSVPAPEVNINFSAPQSNYDWNNSATWGNYEELSSNNDNDCTLLNHSNFDGTWTLGDIAYGYTGPRSAGTYLRSYSVTFTYDGSYSMKEDETTGERIDDPVAQALDGTTITFWVEYNVTGTIPMPE